MMVFGMLPSSPGPAIVSPRRDMLSPLETGASQVPKLLVTSARTATSELHSGARMRMASLTPARGRDGGTVHPQGSHVPVIGRHPDSNSALVRLSANQKLCATSLT